METWQADPGRRQTEMEQMEVEDLGGANETKRHQCIHQGVSGGMREPGGAVRMMAPGRGEGRRGQGGADQPR